ncbi:DUF2493 domain-containing protein [Amycolatopsis sp. H6(2020)]|nr:DUF2493 domain-containing protein [Amycolatopsis sp. H6(2020)]
MVHRVLLTGSRAWHDTAVIRRALAHVRHPGAFLISGACPRGADALCAAPTNGAARPWPTWTTSTTRRRGSERSTPRSSPSAPALANSSAGSATCKPDGPRKPSSGSLRRTPPQATSPPAHHRQPHPGGAPDGRPLEPALPRPPSLRLGGHTRRSGHDDLTTTLQFARAYGLTTDPSGQAELAYARMCPVMYRSTCHACWCSFVRPSYWPRWIGRSPTNAQRTPDPSAARPAPASVASAHTPTTTSTTPGCCAARAPPMPKSSPAADSWGRATYLRYYGANTGHESGCVPHSRFVQRLRTYTALTCRAQSAGSLHFGSNCITGIPEVRLTLCRTLHAGAAIFNRSDVGRGKSSGSSENCHRSTGCSTRRCPHHHLLKIEQNESPPLHR